jgi:hypothetical protein
MPIAEEKLAHYEWAVERRYWNQQCSVRLLRLFETYDANWVTLKYSRAAQDLLSVAFSLWRAAFLAEKESARGKVFADGKRFLEAIIRSNAIGYTQDYNAREWTFNYYTRNARYALQNLNKFWADIAPPYEGKKRTATERWDYCHMLLDRTVENFEGHLRQRRSLAEKRRVKGENKTNAEKRRQAVRLLTEPDRKARKRRRGDTVDVGLRIGCRRRACYAALGAIASAELGTQFHGSN